MKKEVSILIGGDLVPTPSNFNLFTEGNSMELLGEDILKLLKDSDIRCFNLETPLTDCSNSILKNGPCLKAPRSTIEGIKMIDPSIVFLANNHIMDFGVDGLKDTIEVLKSNHINYIGVGENSKALIKSYIYSIKEWKIGFYNCCENEFSIASDNNPGANGFSYQTFDDVKNLSSKCDICIVIYHGGKEHYRYPSPQLQAICRNLIDSGANYVICQHSHCIGSEEKYNEGTILYGQGNFIFDYQNSEYWQTSLLVKIDIDVDSRSIKYIPIVKNGNVVRKGDNKEAQEIINAFEKRNSDIKKQGFIQEEYDEFSKNSYNSYVASLLGHKKIYKILNKITNGKFYSNFYNKKELLKILNCFECEAHRELIINAIKNKIEGDKNEK